MNFFKSREPATEAYPVDSPQAAARVLILAMLSDGRLDPVEVKMLDQVDAYERLGLKRTEFYGVMQQFCGELLELQSHTLHGRLGRATLQRWLDAVQDRELRRQLCRLLFDVIRSDRNLHPGESTMFWQALDGWGLRISDVVSCRGAAPRVTAAPPFEVRRPRTFRLRGALFGT